MNKRTYFIVIIGILALSAVFRAYVPFPIDILGDEATYGFRSVGYFDHMASQLQTTPYQWFETVPQWVKFSFHDHPPFAFLVYHIAFRVFGMYTSVLHLVPLFFGVASVWLSLLIAERLGGKSAGIIAGFLAAIASGSIWISRIALLESIMIPLMLAAFYMSLRAREEKRCWIAAGAFFGLAMITKYTAIFLAPALLTLAYYSFKDTTARKYLIVGILVFFFVLAPLLAYNFMMFESRGHPDYQLSRIFQINSSDWREDFTQKRPVHSMDAFISLTDSVSYAGAILFLASVVWLAYAWRKRKLPERGALMLAIVIIFFGTVWTGAHARFIVPLLPFLCVAGGLAFSRGIIGISRTALRYLLLFLSGIAFFVMIAYSVNTHLFTNPQGIAGISYAHTRAQNYGYEQLDQWLRGIYQTRNSVSDLWEEGSNETLYIYDSNMSYFPRLWYIQRRVTYQGIPFTSTQEFIKLIQENGDDYFPAQGFSKFVFIHALPGTLQVPDQIRDRTSGQIAATLHTQSIGGMVITGSDGNPAFTVYEF